MQALQKQAEAHLAQTGTGLVVRALSTMITPGDWISAKAVRPTPSRTTVTIMFVVLGLLTSGT